MDWWPLSEAALTTNFTPLRMTAISALSFAAFLTQRFPPFGSISNDAWSTSATGAAAADVFDLASDFEGFSLALASVFDSAISPPETSKPMMKDTSLRTPSDGRSDMNA